MTQPEDITTTPTPLACPADHGFLTALIGAQAAISNADPEPMTVIRTILEQSQRLCGGEGAMFDAVGDDALTCVIGVGLFAGFEGVRVDRVNSLAGRAIAGRRTLTCDDAQSDPRVDRAACERIGVRSFVVVPLEHGGRPIGVLKVASSQALAFTDIHATGMEMLAGMVAAKLTQAEAFAAHEQLLAERSAALEALRVSERRFRLLADNAAVGIYEADADGRNTFVNTRWAEMTGTRLEDSDGAGWSASIHPSDRERAIATWFNATQAGRAYTSEFRINGRDGRVMWVHSHAVPIRDEAGTVTGYIGTATDVTDRKRREWIEIDRGEVLEMLARGEVMPAVLRRLAAGVSRQLDQVRVAVAPAEGGDAATALAFADAGVPASLVESMRPFVGEFARAAADADAAATASGAPSAEVCAIDLLSDPRFRDLRVPATVHRVRTLWLRQFRGAGDAAMGLLICCSAEGRAPTPAESQAIVAASRMAGLVIETRQKSDRIAHAATHDALTGLPNRATHRDRLRIALAGARRAGERVSVLAIDVDEFKRINDTHGHAAGDAVLTQFARRLRGQLRESDTLARLGGDEFAAVLPRAGDDAAAGIVAQKLVAALAEPFDVDGQMLRVTGSIGIAHFPDDGAEIETLLAAADEALYVVKSRGRNGWHVRAAGERAAA